MAYLCRDTTPPVAFIMNDTERLDAIIANRWLIVEKSGIWPDGTINQSSVKLPSTWSVYVESTGEEIFGCVRYYFRKVSTGLSPREAIDNAIRNKGIRNLPAPKSSQESAKR